MRNRKNRVRSGKRAALKAAVALTVILSMLMLLTSCALPPQPKDYDAWTFAWPWLDSIGKRAEELERMIDRLRYVSFPEDPDGVYWRVEPPETEGMKFREQLCFDTNQGEGWPDWVLLGVVYETYSYGSAADMDAVYEKICASLTRAFGEPAPRRAASDPDYDVILDFGDLRHETWLLDTAPDYTAAESSAILRGPYGYFVKTAYLSLYVAGDREYGVRLHYGLVQLSGTDLDYLHMDGLPAGTEG